ncbi:MAG: hypothetical protein Q9216_002823 [Gyalolechia sp. 2 TL-2023]
MASFMQMPHTPISEGLRTGQTEWIPPVPIIEEDQPLSDVIRELSQIVKWYFSNMEHDDRGVFETRGFACEIVAWRFLTHLSKHELIDYLLRELPPILPVSDSSSEDNEAFISRPLSARMASNDDIDERSRLLYENRTTPTKWPKILEPDGQDGSRTWGSRMSETTDHDPALSFVGLNALEMAAVAGAKRFLSQRVVQDIIDGIWAGDIIFWESLSTHTRKSAQIYHPRYGGVT